MTDSPTQPRLQWDDADAGWVGGIDRRPSPNQDERPAGGEVSLIVMHFISLPPGQFGGEDIQHLFANSLDPAAHPSYAALARLRVSAHFLIDREGRLTQFVACARRAWHAGVSSWAGRQGCNDFSLGIEMEGALDRPFEPVQMRVAKSLIHLLGTRYPIAAVVGHEHIAPGRKDDPGPGFDWNALR